MKLKMVKRGLGSAFRRAGAVRTVWTSVAARQSPSGYYRPRVREVPARLEDFIEVEDADEGLGPAFNDWAARNAITHPPSEGSVLFRRFAPVSR